MSNLLLELTQAANLAIQDYRLLKKSTHTLSANRDTVTLALIANINGTAQKTTPAKARFIEILDILKKAYDANPRDILSSESDLQTALKTVITKFEKFQSNEDADFESPQKIFAPFAQTKGKAKVKLDPETSNNTDLSRAESISPT